MANTSNTRGSSEQHSKTGSQGHKNSPSKSSPSKSGSHSQQVNAGKQSHKNS